MHARAAHQAADEAMLLACARDAVRANRMNDSLRIDYLATFDTGNASIRWPQKNVLKANQDQIAFDAEILSSLKANLLLKPFISIRHFELFDNLAFAKFVSANNVILRRLSEANLIRPCSRRASSWEEICVDWALNNPDDPMHWHHLTPEDQLSYDRASRRRRITDLRSLEAHLGLTGIKMQTETHSALERWLLATMISSLHIG
jgi:hypothetical protein